MGSEDTYSSVLKSGGSYSPVSPEKQFKAISVFLDSVADLRKIFSDSCI